MNATKSKKPVPNPTPRPLTPHAAAAKVLVDMYRGEWKADADFLAGLIAEALTQNSLEPLKLHMHPEQLWNDVAAKLEELPIETEGLANYLWMYFVHAGGKWWPAYGEMNENYMAGPTLIYGIRYANGDVDSGVALPGNWAHCSIDNKPCIPYMFGVEKERTPVNVETT